MVCCGDQGVSAETEEAAPSIADLTKLYKAAKVRFSDETDDSFKKRAHQETFKLQSGDPENRRLWKALCAKSEEMFTAVYNRLGIDSRLKIQGESFYQQYIPMIVDTLKEKGLLTESDGALVAFVRPGDKPPLMIVKSDKAIGYDTTDMACIWYRSQKLKADRLVYVVDAGQSDHFEVCQLASLPRLHRPHMRLAWYVLCCAEPVCWSTEGRLAGERHGCAREVWCCAG